MITYKICFLIDIPYSYVFYRHADKMKKTNINKKLDYNYDRKQK